VISLRLWYVAVVNIKIAMIWDVMSCSLVGTDSLEEYVVSIFRVKCVSLFSPEYEGSRFL
jgi:hypothetical protein